MKHKWMAAVAAVAIMSAAGARAEETVSVKDLKAQAAALKKQNEALESRLSALEAQAGQTAPASGDFLAQVTKGPLPVVPR